MNRHYSSTLWNELTGKQPIQPAHKATASRSENTSHILEKQRVREWMQTNVITVNPELRIERAWETMARHGVRHLPVVKNGLLVGILTERDLKRAVFGPGTTPKVSSYTTVPPTPNPADYPVEAIMTRCVSIAAPSENLQAVALRMLRDRVGALPVVSGSGVLVGILTLGDLVRAVLAENERPSVTFSLPSPLPTTVPSTNGEPVWAIQ
jgi:CBS domain-containing protein